MLLFVRHFSIKIFKTTQKNSKYFYEALCSHHPDSTRTFPPASVRRNGPTALCKLEVPNVGDVIHHNVRYMLQKASQEKIS